MAKSEADSCAPPLRLKKLYLLAALEVDQLKARMLNIGEQAASASSNKSPQRGTGASSAAHTLAGTCHSGCNKGQLFPYMPAFTPASYLLPPLADSLVLSVSLCFSHCLVLAALLYLPEQD